MTTVNSDIRVLPSVRAALDDAARQIAKGAGASSGARQLTLNEVIAQLKSRRSGDSARAEVFTSVKEAPELTAPSARAMALAMRGAEPEQTDRAVARTYGAGVGRAKDASAAGAQQETLDPATLRGAAALRFWIAKIQDTVDSTTQAQLENTLTLFQDQNKAQRAFHDKTSEEIQNKEAAAQKASETMGCLSKIVAGIVVGVSVAAAAFSGGASLALAGVGLAMMAADAIAEKVTGQSITGRLIAPLIEKVFSPMAKALGDSIAKILKKLNVGDDVADMIGAVAGVLAAAVVVVAGVVITKSANLGKFAGKLAEPLMRSMGKMMPKLISNVSSKLSGAFAKALGQADKFSNALARNATRLTSKVGLGSAELATQQATRVGIVAQGVTSTADAGVTAWTGITRNQIEQAGAELTVLLADMDSLRRIMDMGVDLWQQQTTRLQSLEKVASDAMQFEQNTNLFVLGNARRAAAF